MLAREFLHFVREGLILGNSFVKVWTEYNTLFFRIFRSNDNHERLPSDDEDPSFPGPSQPAPCAPPIVPPSTPVSIAPASPAGSSRGEGPQSEQVVLLASERQSSSYMATQASGSRDIPRVGSLQRVIDALIRRGPGESGDPDEEEGSRAGQPQGSGTELPNCIELELYTM